MRITLYPAGSTSLLSQGEIALLNANGEAERPVNDYHREVRVILYRLCLESYDLPFRSAEWELSIDRALDELKQHLRL